MRVLDLNAPEVEVGVRRLNSAKVRFPEAPTDIALHFGYHGSAEDLAPGFGDSLQQADIFSLEQVGWAASTLEKTQRLADGDPVAREELELQVHGMQTGFWHEMHNAIFDSHVLVHNPDVPKGHAVAVRHEDATQNAMAVAMTFKEDMLKPLQPNDEVLGEISHTLFNIYRKREEYILGHFFPKKLPESERLKVVGFFGILHSGIATALARQAVRQGRDDISISVNDFENLPTSKAYENFLQQRENTAEDILEFLTHDYTEDAAD